jgi:hypothetical protein
MVRFSSDPLKMQAFFLSRTSEHEVHLNDVKNLVHADKRTLRFAITKIIDLLLFKEIISFYSENNTKPINTLCGKRAELLNVKAAGIYSYRYALHGRQNYIWLVKLFIVNVPFLLLLLLVSRVSLLILSI